MNKFQLIFWQHSQQYNSGTSIVHIYEGFERAMGKEKIQETAHTKVAVEDSPKPRVKSDV
jgi:hypothetical protein